MDKHINTLTQLLEWWWNEDTTLFGKFDNKNQNLMRVYIYIII